MASKLSIFNEALGILGEPPLQSIDQDREAARQLRDKWNAAVRSCFEQGQWNIAVKWAILGRLAETPLWGYKYYYGLPADWYRTLQVNDSGIEADISFSWQDTEGKIATDFEVVYLKYASTEAFDNVGRWSQSFVDFVAADLAKRTGPKLNPSNVDMAMQLLKRYRSEAKSLDAQQNPAQLRRPGRWSNAALGGYRSNGSNRRERGY